MPLGTFKATATTVLKNLNENRQHLVLTQHGRPAAVVLSPSEYDALVEHQRFVAGIREGLADAEAGKTYSLDEVAAELLEDP